MGSQTLAYADEIKLTGRQIVSLMKDVHARGKHFRCRAGGGSMMPFIRSGDVLIIASLKTKKPGLGDVVVYGRNVIEGHIGDGIIVHRIIQKTQEGFKIQGDNQQLGECDGPIMYEDLLGLVIGVARKDKAVRLGLGPERYLIGFLSRIGFLGIAIKFAKPGIQLLNWLMSYSHRD